MGNAKRKGLFALWAATVSVALAAVLCMCFPMAEVHAAETYTVSRAEDFVYQMANAKDGDTVQLGGDITIDLTDEAFVQSVYGSGAEPNKDLYLRAENEPYAITLDLNGKKLEIVTGSDKSCFTLGSGITLTVTDSSAEGSGTVVGHSNGNLFVGEAADSSLVLEKVKVEFTGYSKDGISIQPTGSVISTVGGVTLNDVTYTPEADGPALIDDTAGAQISYVAKTAEELVAAVADSRYATVVLGTDITQNITVSAGRTLTLDLNGYTLTTNTSGDGSAAVNNYGTLTIVNTDTANTGVIERADGSTWYTVFNEGTLTIGAEGEGYGALEVKNNNAQDSSSLVENNHDCSPDGPATLTIVNGTYTSIGSNLNAVKNDDYGICIIRGGSFTNEATGGSAVLSAGAMTIIAGTFEQKNSAATSNALTNKGAATSFVVEGGNFIGTINDTADCLEISGGTYSNVFSADCLAEKAALYKNTAGKLVVATEQPADAEKIVAGTESGTSDIDKLFTSLQAAADSLTGASNGFIFMYDSVDGALTIPADTTITLYMGYTLTAAADTVVTVNGSLIFATRDGMINGNVAVNAGGAVTVQGSANIVFNGSLTVAESASAAIANGVFNGRIINNGGDIELSGGTYANEPESAWLVDGYGILADEDGTYRVAQLIAQMNYTRDGQPVTEVFANWDELRARLPELSAANGEIEIILLDDVPRDSASLVIPTGLTVVFDKGSGKNVLADIVNYGILTIRGNSSSGSVSGKIENKEGGELVIESGYFRGTLQNERADGAGISVQGGMFNGADLIRSVSGYLAEGYCFTSMNTSAVARVGAVQAVAEVADGGYALRFSTFALANTYGGYALGKTITITLLQDASVGKLSVGSTESRAGATDWIIDLDGKTLTLTGDAGLAFGRENYVSTFTLRDGTVESGNEGQTYLLTVDNGSTLIFESGTYYGGITRTNGTIDIREGCTFDADIRDFLTGGLTQNTAGTVVNPANAVVMIETADGNAYYYDTLQEALAEAKDGDTVRLLSDVEPAEMLRIGQAVTLDLNGHTIESKYDGTYAINIESNGVKITDSTVSGSRADGQACGTIIASTLALRISGYNDVTIEKIAIESTTTAIQIGAGQGSSVTVDGVTIEARNGILVAGSYYGNGAAAQEADPSTYNRLFLTNSRITGAGYGVFGNGLNHGTVITIADSTITCTGVSSSLVPGKTTATAVFHPQVGNLTISGNTTISGPTGIEMRAGTLTIEDNSVTVESTIGFNDGFFTVPNGDGTTLGGVAVGISQHTTNLPITVAISGGTFSAQTGCYAFYETDLQDGGAQGVAVSVKGGSFTGKVFSGNLNGFISGVEPDGSFSEALPAGYFEDGYAAAYDAESGRYEVVSSADTVTYPVLVESGDTEVRYASLVEAFAAAKDGDIIRLIGAAELGQRIQLRSDTAKALTLDLNGQTLTLGAGLGNTSALWVGENVTLTIKATGGGTIDGTGMDDVSVPVSAMEENAAVIIEGGTIVVDTDMESCVYVRDGKLTINGGTFINNCKTPYKYVEDGSSPALTVNVYDSNTDGQYLIVNGGTFVGRNPLLGDTNPKVTGSYLGEGVRVGLDAKGQYVAFTGEDVPEGIAVVYSAETADEGALQNVATVYTAAALTAALAGDGQFADNTYSVVRLGANIEGEFTIARSLTLDLNGFTLSSSSEKSVLDITGGEEPTGTITVSVMSSEQGGERGDGGAIEAGVYVGLWAKQYADVTITGITVTGAHSGIFVSEEYNLSEGIDVPWQTKLTMSDCAVTGTSSAGVYVMGTTNAEPTVFIAEDCSITGGWYAVTGNGAQHNTSIRLTDCNLTGTKGEPASTDYENMSLGIYHPQEGTLVIDGGTVTGVAAGIEMRAGTLIVRGGAEIKATSTTANVTPNDNGSTTAGAAIAVSQHTTNRPISVTLGEGTYTGVYALLERDVEDEATVGVTLALESGGTYNGEVASETCEGFVSGGTYRIMPAQSYFATGYYATYDESTGFYETKPGSFVAAVGETAYATLADAVRAAASGAGNTITLIAEENTVEVNEMIEVRVATSLTFDLNGKTIVGGDIDTLFFLSNSNITFKNGTIRAQNLAFEIAGGTSAFGRTVTFAADLTIISENDAAVFVYNSITLDTSADIQAHYAAIMGNGTDSRYPRINIRGGDITSDTTALYLPQPNGVTTISGGTITGATGVEIRGGTLNINGGTITATGDELATEENGSGSTVTKGAAIAVSPYASAARLTVNVTAGTFSGVYAFYEANLNPDGASVDAVAMTVSLTGGTYDGNVGSERLTGFISGGQYLAMPAEEYFDANYTAQYTNGYFTVVPSSALPAARLNAQTDVRAYAAQFGIVWTDLAADDSVETGEKAAALLSAYNAIDEAMTQGDVAKAKLAAFEAVDAYVAAFDTYKNAQLEALAGELGTEGEDNHVVLPTAAWAALREAGSRELFNFYLDKAKQEVNDIRAFRGDIKEQAGKLTDLQSALTGLNEALFGSGQSGNGAFADLEKTLSDAITAAQTAIVGEGSSETLADLKSYLSGTILSAIESTVAELRTALLGDEAGSEGILVTINSSLRSLVDDLDGLTGALATEARNLGDAIAAAQSDIDTIVAAVGALGTAGADDLATAITNITADLGAVQTTVDSIAASVSASTAVESAKTDALTDIETWLTGYVDEILAAAPKASAGVMTAMAYTAETTDGDVYAKLREAFDEENAALVLRYYNEALASIDAALTVSDVTTAVSTFKAQVASVEAAAQNATTVSLTAVYVLLAVLLAAIIVAIVLLLLKKQRPAPAPASADAQPAPVQPAPAAPVSDTAAAAAASTDTANIAFMPDDTAATDDNDDRERVVIEASVRTFAEAYDDLDEEARKLFNDVVDYALGKEGAKEVQRTSGVCVKLGSKQIVKMTVRRGNPVALFVLENEMLKDFRRATNAQAKLKVRATELIIREEADLATAYTMVDLSVEQIKKDAEALKERRRAARRARRKAHKAAEAEDGGKEE